MSYDIRTIAFQAEIIHPPVELHAKLIQGLHDELFDHPELSYQNFSVAPNGIHLTNMVEQQGAVSSATFLPDRVQFREEGTGKTVEEFGAKVVGIIEKGAPKIGIPMVMGQQFVVRSLLNPRHITDSRAFLAQSACRLEEAELSTLERPMGLFGMKMVFPQTPEVDNLFSIRIESFNQDPRSLFVENVGTFTHCQLPANVNELADNLMTTYRFLADKVTSFISRFDRPKE